MIIEILDKDASQRIIGKYYFDDVGPVRIEIQNDSFSAVQWVRDDVKPGAPNDMPIIKGKVLEMHKYVRAKMLGFDTVTMLRATPEGVERFTGPKLISTNDTK